jgi:hypothetical protein
VYTIGCNASVLGEGPLARDLSASRLRSPRAAASTLVPRCLKEVPSVVGGAVSESINRSPVDRMKRRVVVTGGVGEVPTSLSPDSSAASERATFSFQADIERVALFCAILVEWIRARPHGAGLGSGTSTGSHTTPARSQGCTHQMRSSGHPFRQAEPVREYVERVFAEEAFSRTDLRRAARRGRPWGCRLRTSVAFPYCGSTRGDSWSNNATSGAATDDCPGRSPDSSNQRPSFSVK